MNIPPPPGDDEEENHLPPEPPNPQPEPESSPLDDLLAASDADSKEEILRFAHRNGLAEDDPSIQQMLIMARREQALASALNRLASQQGCLTLIQQERRELEAARRLEDERRHDEALAAEASEREVREDNREVLRTVKSQNLWILSVGVLILFATLYNTTRVSRLEAATSFAPAAQQLLAATESARQMQAITHSRLILQTKQAALEKEWWELQIAWREQGDTEQNRAKKAELEAFKVKLDAEWQQQQAKEAEALQGPERTPIQMIDETQGGGHP